MRVAPLIGLILVGLAIPVAAEGNPDFTIEFRPGEAPQYSGPLGLAVLTNATAGQRYEWNLTLAKDYTVGEFRIHGAFAVERAKQIVPEVDDHYFAERMNPDVWDVDGPARIFNVTGAAGDYVYRLGFPGPGESKLKLTRDVAAPTFTVGPATQITHYSFLLTTQTNEYAIGNLLVRPVAGGEEIPNPTATLALRQTFPVQGLKADTEYVFFVRFLDWAENTAESRTFNVRTKPLPDAPEPRIIDLEPAPNSTVPPDAVSVSARFESPDSPVAGDDVRLFFDKREVLADEITVLNDTIRYHPPLPLRVGHHSVSVEVTNEAGGAGIARWSFEVGGSGVPGPSVPLMLAFLLAAVAAVSLRRRQE